MRPLLETYSGEYGDVSGPAGRVAIEPLITTSQDQVEGKIVRIGNPKGKGNYKFIELELKDGNIRRVNLPSLAWDMWRKSLGCEIEVGLRISMTLNRDGSIAALARIF